MMLTGKALEDFKKWSFEKYGISYLELYENVFLNAIIIEWLDSVGIYVDIVINFQLNTPRYVYYYGKHTNQSKYYKTRQEATEKAILKANEIYNERTNLSN